MSFFKTAFDFVDEGSCRMKMCAKFDHENTISKNSVYNKT